MKIATLQLITLVLVACSGEPKTHTSVPALDAARTNSAEISRNVIDAKDSLSRARTIGERIDHKAILIDQWVKQHKH